MRENLHSEPLWRGGLRKGLHVHVVERRNIVVWIRRTNQIRVPLRRRPHIRSPAEGIFFRHYSVRAVAPKWVSGRTLRSVNSGTVRLEHCRFLYCLAIFRASIERFRHELISALCCLSHGKFAWHSIEAEAVGGLSVTRRIVERRRNLGGLAVSLLCLLVIRLSGLRITVSISCRGICGSRLLAGIFPGSRILTRRL